MKKNFFKKLSFVMALAMIVSVLAPAAGAFAATAPKLSASTKYLYLGTDNNEYDFNIANKQTGWKYLWSSANENVAEVNAKNGLTTATGAGSTKVSVVITDADGEEIDELTATVVVRDNIKELTITNVPADNKLAVGVSNDFNRSYVTVAGKTKGSEAKTAWTVTKDGKATTDATIDASGVFVAKAAGEYVVEARAFQSSAKRTAWVSDPVKYASYVTSNVASVKVTVAASIKTVKQVNLTKFTVEFDSDMSKTDLSATTAKLFQVINGTKVATGTEKIKAVTFDTTGKFATVEMYSNLVSKAAYEFNYGTLVGTFTAANKDLKEVATIQFADVSATVNTLTDLKEKVTGLNKDGVVIFNGKDDSTFAGYVGFSGDLGTNGYLDTTNKNVYIYTKGFSATLTAKFSHYVYNETTKVYDNLTAEDTAVVTGTEVDTNLNTSTLQYLVKSGAAATNSTTGWATSGFSVAANDRTYYISTRFKNNDATSTTNYTVDTLSGTAGNTDKFTYVSSNTDKLIINGDYIYPISEGVVTVLVNVTNTDGSLKVVGTFDLTIQPKRTFASATIDKPSLTVSNGSLGADGTTTLATITVKDTMNAAIDVATAVTTENRPTGYVQANDPVVTAVDQNGDDDGKVFVKVNAISAKDGVYYFKIKLTAGTVDKYAYVTVNVLDGAVDTAVTSWRFELSKNSVDLNKVNAAQTITYGVFGYNSKGAKVQQLAIADYDVTIKKGGTPIADPFTDTSVSVVTAATSPAAFSAFEVNTYVVEATLTSSGASLLNRPVNSSIGLATFSVVDTSTKTFVVEDPTVAPDTVLEMVKDAFSLYLNGEKVSDANEANISGVTFNVGDGLGDKTTSGDPITAGKSVFIKSLQYQVLNDNGTRTEYKFDVNVTIKAE